MKCAWQDCINHLECNLEDTKVRYIECDLCNRVMYCSQKCKVIHFEYEHKNSCIKNKQQVSDRESPEKYDRNTEKETKRKKQSDFEVTKVKGRNELGKGAFGNVTLVKLKETNQQYALKTMSKKFIFQYSKPENLRREIKIQKKLNDTNIVKLEYFFEDKDNVYLVLEYAQNGSLFTLMRKKKKFTEDEAFHYFYQTCKGMHYLHKQEIIHRDLKPENLVLDKENNIKICDFGWSAESKGSAHRTTFCGTVDYMAPEMLCNKPYNASLDVWCQGILLFELLHGYPPFSGKSESEKMQKIRSHKNKIKFAESISEDIRALVEKMLQYEPNNRYTVEQILESDWIRHCKKINGISDNNYNQQDLDTQEQGDTTHRKLPKIQKIIDEHYESPNSPYEKNLYNIAGATNSKSFSHVKKNSHYEHLRQQSISKNLTKSRSISKTGLPPKYQNKVSDKNFNDSDKNIEANYGDFACKKTVKKDFSSTLEENMHNKYMNRKNTDSDMLESKARTSWKNKAQSKSKVFRTKNNEKKKIEMEKRIDDEKKQEGGIFSKLQKMLGCVANENN